MQQRNKTEQLAIKRLTKYNFLTNAMTLSVLMISTTFMQQAWAENCDPYVPATTPYSDFTMHNDGTVTHLSTGLMWKVCSEGQAWSAGSCSGTATTHTWDAALKIPQSVNTGGGYPLNGENYSNWRLPNLKELKSITELQCSFPAINATIFPTITLSSTYTSFYWSSSPNIHGSNIAWGVDFGSGINYSNYRSENYWVRLVRSGQ